MTDQDCIRFLQAVLPRLGYRWAGFRKVRRQVCRRVRKRFAELGLEGWEAYRARLESDPEECAVFDRLCRITISRFFRDRHLWRVLSDEVLPRLARDVPEAGEDHLDVWSAGCASGEEPLSLALLWHRKLASRFPAVGLRILATDVDLHLLVRARRAIYPRGSLREMPEDWRREAFEERGEGGGDERPELRLTGRVRALCRDAVRWVAHDVRTAPPGREFRLILCRNLAFTYLDRATRERVGESLLDRLCAGGFLAVGGHEELPANLTDGGEVEPWPGERRLWRKVR